MLGRTCALTAALLALTLATGAPARGAPAEGAPAEAAPAEIAIGKPFPAILLPDAQDGRPRSIVNFRGKKIVLHVFASW
jgi:hypothetical protein